MKKSIIMSVMVLALFAASMFAQTPPTDGGGGGSTPVPTPTVPDKVPLASANVLKAYALTLVGQISVQVGGESVSGDHYRFVDYPYADADPERMANLASKQVLHFSSTTNDKLNSIVYYQSRQFTLPDPNSEGGAGTITTSFPLFSGSTNFMLEYYKGAWRVPAKAYRVEIDYYSVPFVISTGVQDAYIIYRDDNGNEVGFYSFQNEGSDWLGRGVLFLTEEMTSRTGEMFLIMPDGSKVIYDLGSGDRKLTVTVEATGFRPTIPGIRTLPDNTTNIVYRADDEIIRVAAIPGSSAQVLFPPGLKRYPTKVFVTSTILLAVGPNLNWIEFNPYVEPIRFTFGDPVALIRFEYQTAQPTIGGDGGQGQ